MCTDKMFSNFEDYDLGPAIVGRFLGEMLLFGEEIAK